MKYLFLCLFLISCEFVQNETVTHHWLAKLAAKDGNEVCYNINYPDELIGKYCLRYEGIIK